MKRKQSPTTPEEKFVSILDRMIEWRRNNTYDPHGIDNAVIVSLVEVRSAFAEAYKLPPMRLPYRSKHDL